MSPLSPEEHVELAALQRRLFAPGAQPTAADEQRFAALHTALTSPARVDPDPEPTDPLADLFGDGIPVLDTPAAAEHASEEDEVQAPDGEDAAEMLHAATVCVENVDHRDARRRLSSMAVGLALGAVIWAAWGGITAATTERPAVTATLVASDASKLPPVVAQSMSSDQAVAYDVTGIADANVYVIEDKLDRCVIITYSYPLVGPELQAASFCESGARPIVFDFPLDILHGFVSEEPETEWEWVRIIQRDEELTVWSDAPSTQRSYL